MNSSRTVKRRAGTWPRRWLGIVLSLVLALGTLGFIAPAAHAEGAVVSITKAIDNKKDAYDKGDTVTYRLNIQCSSLEDPCVTGTVTDVLDPNLQYTSFTVGRNTIDGALSKAPVTLAQSGQTLTFTVGDASDPAKYFMDGESMDIVVNAKVIAVPTNAGRTIDNSASIVSPGTPTDTDGPVTIVVNPEAAAVYDWTLTKSKTAPSGNPAIGGDVTYDIRFTRPRNPATGGPVAGGVDIASFVLKDAIPAGAEYVNAWSDYASGSASYDAGTNSVTFPSAAISASGLYCGDPCISYYVAHLVVKYPSPAYADGDQPINKATADITYANGHPNDTLTAEAKITLNEPTKSVYTQKWTGNSVHPTPGENVLWVLSARNTGNVGLESLIITDQIPEHLSNVQVGASDWSMPKQTGSGTFEYTLDGSTWLNLGTLNTSTSTKLDVPAGAKAVRMTVTDLGIDHYSGFQVFGTVDLDTPPGYVMENCMSYDGSVGPVLKSNCATYNIKEKPQATVYTGKTHEISNGGSHAAPGDEFSWLLEWRTLATKVPTTSTVTDVLPSQFELITETPPCLGYKGYWEAYPTSCGATATTPAYTTEAVAGGTKITFTDMALPTLPSQSDNKYFIRLKVRVKDGAPAATYTNKMTVALPSNYEATCNWGNECSSTDDVVVDTAAAAGLQKWDKGTEPNVAQDTAQASANCPDWDGFTRYPCVAQTLPGGDFTYRLKWSNQGNVPLTDAIVYDVLPYVGDTGVGEVLSGADRKTEWTPVLTGPITLDAGLSTATGSGYVVEYNLTTNPCRPELKDGSADGTWQASCDDTWVTAVSDWSTVKSFRIRAFEASGAEWTPGTRMVFIIPMKAPADAPKSKLGPVDLSIAWNSAAQRVFQVKADGSTVRLQATEPRKVGIIIPAPYVSIGDYVWYDANYNGQQDAGELPAAGVKVTLKDKDGNVVGTTTTDADGYYWFQNLTEKANYTLEFEKPSGYNWTTQNSGADKTDSDVDPATSTISFTAPTWVEGVSKNLGGHDKADDPTLDAGLIEPIAQVSVGDYVWKDADHDGIQDSGEPGIKGVVLTIKDESGNAVTDVLGHSVGSVTTDDNGYYLFPLLPVGHTYTVSIDTAASATALAGLAPTLANQGGDTAVDSSTGSATSVPMTTDGQKDPTLDFGFYDAAVSIGDFVWYDTNRDGIQQGTEPVVEDGMVVNLYAAGAPAGAAPLKSATTTGGYYAFTDLTPSTAYVVEFVKPSGTTFTTQTVTTAGATTANDSNPDTTTGRATVTTPASGSNLADPGKADDPTIDAGLVKYNLTLAKTLTTTGTINPGQDVTFTLTPHNDGPVDALAGWTVTEVLPAGLTLTSMTGAGYTFSGNVATASGSLAAGQDGPVITVTAKVSSSFTTGSLRNVAYVDKAPSDVAETNPLGTAPAAGTDTSTTGTDNDAHADLTVSPLVSIGDYVWYDNNRNGIQDANEPVYAGMTVNLLNAAGSVVATTQTNANGYYVFANLPPSTTYSVQFVTAAGESFTTQNASGSTTVNDSNPVVTTGLAAVTTPADGQNRTGDGLADDPTIDAGVVKYNLVLTKALTSSGPVYAGSTVTFELTPSNEGPATALTGWSVTEVLPKGLTLVSMTGDGYTYAGNVATATAPLAGGATAPKITVTATVDAGFVGGVKNVAYVDKASTDVPETNPLGTPLPTTSTNTATSPTDNDAEAPLTVDSLVSMGDHVWWDTNRNGVQDAGEAPVAGVSVTLHKADGTTVGTPTTTDANGFYSFVDLTPGAGYYVVFTPPADATFTTQNSGTNDAIDSDAAVATGRADFTAPASGSNSATAPDNPTVDAGLVRMNLTLAKKLDTAGPFGVGDTVTFTLTPHNDGEVNALAGWSVTDVLPKGLTLVGLTGDTGVYTFSGATATSTVALAAGTDGAPITVTATIDANTIGTLRNVAYVSPASADIAETNPLVIPTTSTDTAASSTDNDAQAELTLVPVSIGDHVWWDVNRDGLQSEGEAPVAGVTVTLYQADGTTKVGSTKTDDKGFYSFVDLAPGQNYVVVFTKPDGTTFTTPLAGDVAKDSNPNASGVAPVHTPKSGQNSATTPDDPTIDAGLVRINLVLAKKLETAAPFGAGDTVTFTLTPHNDGEVDALKGWTVSDVLPKGLTLVSMTGDAAAYSCDNNGAICTSLVPLAAGKDGAPITVTATIDGYTTGTLHNVAWIAPVSGETPETNPLGTTVPTTGTDTSATSTDNDAQASLTVLPVSIGDHVWWDVNRDGLQTAGEAPVKNVVVTLYKADGTTKVASTTTDDKGFYSFTDLAPAQAYVVVFTKPDGTTFTAKGVGSDIEIDSNADVATGAAPVTTPRTGANSATAPDQPSIDAGLVKINLTLAKNLATIGGVHPGDTVSFTLRPHNDGPVDALAGWSVTEVLPSGLTLVSMKGDDYTCSGTTCVSSVPLRAGQDGSLITVMAKITATGSGSLRNVAYVSPASGETPETNPLGTPPAAGTDTSKTSTDNDADAKVTFTTVPPVQLAFTGSSGLTWTVLGGALLVILGALVALIARRREEELTSVR